MELLKLMAMLVLSILLMIVALNVMHFGLSFLLAISIIKLIPVINPDSLVGIVAHIVLTSIFTFLITCFFYLLMHKKKEVFVHYFEINYQLNTYIWGLLTLLTLAEPDLIKENIVGNFEYVKQFSNWAAACIFFVTFSNYSLFNSVILDKKIKFINKACD